MSSVTAVPLQPIQKGSVRRLWLGVVIVVAAAGLLAWNGLRDFGRTSSGITYQIVEPGTGEHPAKDDFALVGYKGMLPDGTVFDQNAQAPMDLTSMLPGFAEAVTLLKKGGRARVYLPASLGYGDSPPGDGTIPANSPLIFEINLVEFRGRAEIMEMQRQMQMQQMLQQQMGGGGAPGAGDLPPGAMPVGPDGMPIQP